MGNCIRVNSFLITVVPSPNRHKVSYVVDSEVGASVQN